jgi:titin
VHHVFYFTDKPGPVRNLGPDEITPDSVHLTWKEPEDNGGCEISGYIIERRDANRQSYNKIGQTTKCEFQATKLTTGAQYVFRVFAENEVGQGEPVDTKTITAKFGFGKLNTNSSFPSVHPLTKSRQYYLHDFQKNYGVHGKIFEEKLFT